MTTPDCQCDQSKKPATFDSEKVKYNKTNPNAQSVAGPWTILQSGKGRWRIFRNAVNYCHLQRKDGFPALIPSEDSGSAQYIVLYSSTKKKRQGENRCRF